MPLHDTEHLTMHEVCNPPQPAVDTWLYTDGLHGGLGPELAVATRPDPDHDSAVHLSSYEVQYCLPLWADERVRGLHPTPVVLHDGVLTVQPVEVHSTDTASLDQAEEVHLCVLEEEATIEVVTWTATIDADVLPAQRPDATLPMEGLRSCLQLGKSTTHASPAALLLDHLEPERANPGMVTKVARVGAIGAMQLPHRLGASATVAILRNIATALNIDVAEVRDQAADTARRWSHLLRPPDDPHFERRWDLPSVALAHHLEATVLALELYPTVPRGILNWATMTTMWLLSDGRWSQGRTHYEPVTDLLSDLTDLTSGAWQSLAASFDRDGELDAEALAALASWLGRGARAPRPHEFLPLVPTSLPEPVRARIAASAADLAVCRLVGIRRTDPLATVLAGSSLFNT